MKTTGFWRLQLPRGAAARHLILFLVIGWAVSVNAQDNKKAEAGDTTLVNGLIDSAKQYFGSDPARTINLSEQAVRLARDIAFSKGEAYALKNIGIAYYFQGKYLEALDYYGQSVAIFKLLGDNVGMANLYSNIGVVYYDQAVEDKALENYLESLKYSDAAGDKYRTLIALNNIGGLYAMKSDTYDKALSYYLRALPICEELGKKEEMGAIEVNIGFIYFNKYNNDSALQYFQRSLRTYGDSESSLNAHIALGKLYQREGKFQMALNSYNRALSLANSGNDKLSSIKALTGLGEVYAQQGNNKQALTYFHRAQAPALEIGARVELKELYAEMAKAYKNTNDFRNAFVYQTRYADIKDTLYNRATDKKLLAMQFDSDLKDKQSEITVLTKDKALAALELRRQKAAQQALLIGLGLVFLIAILIYRNYRAKVKTHKILNRQKNQIEELLLNILPEEVANELQVFGSSPPRNFEFVSVMFTDFKGFTAIADKISPGELVKDLSECFIAFDNIIEKYNLEKIKTIGDAYMCAGGIPTPEEGHVKKMIKASLEIRDFMAAYNVKRKKAGLEEWNLRIGMHAGPIVAGVVGKKKYAYDIWGSTVNIASRMESNGEPGMVNISSGVYELIKDEYECSYRGKIYAKNIGEIDMYFVESVKQGVLTEDADAEVIPEEPVRTASQA